MKKGRDKGISPRKHELTIVFEKRKIQKIRTHFPALFFEERGTKLRG
jgi:hypothetical protein